MTSDESYFFKGSLVVSNWSKAPNTIRFPPQIYQNFFYTFDLKKDISDDSFSLELSISEFKGDKHEISVKTTLTNRKFPNKSVEKIVIDSFSLTQRVIYFKFPLKISEITEENGYLDNDSFSLQYELTHGKVIKTNDKNETTEKWNIPNFELEESFRSPTFHFNDLAYHIERRIDYKSLDFFVIVENISSPLSLNAKLTIISPKEKEKSISKERKVEFKNIGDIARFIMGFNVYDLSLLLDIENQNTLSLIFTLSNNNSPSAKSEIPLPPGVPLPPPPPITQNLQKQKEPEEILPFAGLKNQGATCYLNSLLQSLYHIPAFRKLVFSLPTSEKDNLSTSIPLALQILFARMQLDNQPCSTQGLTISFGWTEYQSFIQQDIQELSRVLMDNLSRKLIGTQLEGSIDKLFRGESRSYIECVNVPYKSERTEYFYDLQLQIKGCPTLEDSFKLYSTKELLSGPNQYNTEEFGKQDAYMGQDFVYLPPVLQLHLSRFEYDFDTDMMTKINDKQTFPEEIDLTPFTKDQTGDNIYELFGVLVHAGSLNGGHYYAYLRPSKEKEWFCFNDSNVKRATKKQAIDDNFGKENPMKFDKGFSAYMLVYVKKNMIDELFTDVDPKAAIPKHVLKFIEENPDDEKVFRKMRCESKPIIFNVTTEDGLKENAKESKIGFSHQNCTKDITLMSDKSTKDLYNRVSEDFDLKNKEFRLWQCFSSGSPSIPIENNDSILLEDIKQTSIFVQFTGIMKENPKDSLTIFAFFYFLDKTQEKAGKRMKQRPLHYLNALICNKNEKIDDLCEKINEIVGIPQKTKLLVYEATEPQLMRQLINEETLQNNGIATGNIIIFNIDPENSISISPSKLLSSNELEEYEEDEKEEENITKWSDLKGDNEMNTILQFYTNKVTQVLIQVFSYDTLKKVGTIKIPRACSLNDLKEMAAICAKIELTESDSIQLFKRDVKEENIPASSPISYSTNTVDQIFPITTKREPLIFFLLFKGISETELRTRNSYIVEFSEDSMKVKRKTRMVIKKPSNCRILEEELKRMQILKEDVKDVNLRFSIIKNGKFAKIFTSLDDKLPENLSIVRVDYSQNSEDFVVMNENEEKILQFVLCEPDPMNNAKPAHKCFMHKIKLSTKVNEMKILCKEVFGLNDDDAVNLMFGQELAKIQKSSFFDDNSTFGEILKKDVRKDPPIYVIKKVSGTVGTMACAEADMSIVIYN